MKITIDKSGVAWVASDGEISASGIEPDIALAELLEAQLVRGAEPKVWVDLCRDAELREPIESSTRRVDRSVIALVKFMTLGAPDVMIDSELELITRAVADWKAARAVARQSAPE